MIKVSWGSKVSPEFVAKVVEGCESLGWAPEPMASYLMACMAFETGETFSSSVRNAAGSGAIGLIQFMPKTASTLGTSTAELDKLSPVEQLDYVFSYFSQSDWNKRIKTLEDMYMAILMPSFIGKPDDAVIFDGGKAYSQNSGLDVSKDGKVTKREAAELVRKKYERGLTEGYYRTT